MLLGNIIKVLVVTAALISCSQNQSEKGVQEALQEAGLEPLGETSARSAVEPPGAAAGPGYDAAADGRQNLGGISVALPPGWQSVPPSTRMRVAEYRLAGAAGAAADVSLAVFQLGGSVEDNIQRWLGQFTELDAPEEGRPRRRQQEVDGVPVSLVDISGSYAGMGPMGAAQGPRPDYRMLGAVAEGPQGLVFFKVTGPQAEIAAWAEGFEILIGSMRRQ